jgi:hypothetical protein
MNGSVPAPSGIPREHAPFREEGTSPACPRNRGNGRRAAERECRIGEILVFEKKRVTPELYRELAGRSPGAPSPSVLTLRKAHMLCCIPPSSLRRTKSTPQSSGFGRLAYGAFSFAVRKSVDGALLRVRQSSS